MDDHPTTDAAASAPLSPYQGPPTSDPPAGRPSAAAQASAVDAGSAAGFQQQASPQQQSAPQPQNAAPPQVVIYNNNQVSGSPAVTVVVAQKSVFVALALTFFFGPLGMFYSTIMGAVIMLVVSVIVGALTLGFGLLVTWPVCMVWSAIAADRHNKMLVAGGAVTQSIHN